MINGQTVYEELKKEREQRKGSRVRILVGKYAGREAICRSVIFEEDYHNQNFSFMYCVPPLRIRPPADDQYDVLNDGEARMYRHPEEFEWI